MDFTKIADARANASGAASSETTVKIAVNPGTAAVTSV